MEWRRPLILRLSKDGDDPPAALPRLLAAARRVVDANPRHPEQIEEYLIVALASRPEPQLPLQAELLRFIDTPTPRHKRWHKALAITALVNKYNPDLGEALLIPLFDLLLDALHHDPKRSRTRGPESPATNQKQKTQKHQSNNQT